MDHDADPTRQTDQTDPTQRPSSAAERDELSRRVNAVLEERGVRFGGAGGHAFRADPVPRLLDPGEWELLADGLAQRIRALDAFVADVYAERRCVADGVLPAHVLDATPYLEQDLTGSAPVAGAWISVAGFDVVRDEDGTLLVLEDNVRTPSGMAYAMAVSEAVSEVLGVEPSSGLDECAAALRALPRGDQPRWRRRARAADRRPRQLGVLRAPAPRRRGRAGARRARRPPARRGRAATGRRVARARCLPPYRAGRPDARAPATPPPTWRACCSSRGVPVGWAW